MYKVVFLRHGQSVWNKENRFTGWTDVALSEQGVEEARRAGALLEAEGLEIDLAFTSYLRRAIKTLWLALEQLDQMYIPVTCDWRLNERHYGALQGLNKAETAAKHGKAQVHEWRRSYTTRPPALEATDERHPSHEARYRKLDPKDLPLSECLKDTVDRVIPYWQSEMEPHIRSGRLLLVAAHGNSIRALVKHLDGISDEDIADLNIPTGVPLVYELDASLKPLSSRYLGDQAAIEAATQAVANQLDAK